MSLEIITVEGDIPFVKTTDKKGVFINGKELFGIQDVKIESSDNKGTELSIRVAVKTVS